MSDVLADFLRDLSVGWQAALIESLQAIAVIALIAAFAVLLGYFFSEHARLRRLRMEANLVLPEPDRNTVRRQIDDPEWEAEPGHVRSAGDCQ